MLQTDLHYLHSALPTTGGATYRQGRAERNFGVESAPTHRYKSSELISRVSFKITTAAATATVTVSNIYKCLNLLIDGTAILYPDLTFEYYLKEIEQAIFSTKTKSSNSLPRFAIQYKSASYTHRNILTLYN